MQHATVAMASNWVTGCSHTNIDLSTLYFLQYLKLLSLNPIMKRIQTIFQIMTLFLSIECWHKCMEFIPVYSHVAQFDPVKFGRHLQTLPPIELAAQVAPLRHGYLRQAKIISI